VDWTNERYVRFYTRDTVEWLCLSWHARGLFGLLMRVSDRAGVIELGVVGPKGIAPLVHAPWKDIEGPLAELLEDGCIVHETCDSGTSRLLLPNFLAAQEATASDAQRQRESRARRRTVTLRDDMASHSVTETSRSVTAGHVQSQAVTPPVPPVPPVPDKLCRASAKVRRVFDAWQADIGRTGAKLDAKRTSRIKARLNEGFTPEQLIEAIRNRRNDPWLMGKGDSPRIFDGIETLLRDAQQVERLIALTVPIAVKPRGGRETPIDRERREAEAYKGWKLEAAQ
jgi:hypothetical protein